MQTAWQINEQLGPTQAVIPLRQLLKEQWLLPSRFIHYLRIRRQVLLNGQYHSMNTLVHAGDQISLSFKGDEFRTSKSHYLATPHAHPQILFENRDLLVVNKAAGQKTHPNQPEESGTLLNDVQGYLSASHSAAYMVHRIDQATSGAVIVAKNPIVVPILDRRIANREIHRTYLAVVQGRLTPSKGEFSWPIGRDLYDRRKRRVNGYRAQAALTHYEVLRYQAGKSLVRLSLATGRTHQIRVHLAYAGYPIIGDPLYNHDDQPRMLLHGYQQSLILPFSQRLIKIKAPIPPYFPINLVK